MMLNDIGQANSLNILLVEDDEVDRMAVRRAFGKLDVPANIVEAGDGRIALAILQGEGDIAPPPDPFLILLDINMPRMDGLELLRHLRSEAVDPKLRNAIVFILTTSEADRDRDQAYAHNVAGYLVKPTAGGLKGIAQMLIAYRQVVLFP